MSLLFSVHVPKTAGTSFRRALEAAYGTDHLHFDYDRIDDPIAPFHADFAAWRMAADRDIQSLPLHVQAVHGHFSAVKYRPAFPDGRWITWLRHPVGRLISHFFFWKSLPRDGGQGHSYLPAIWDGRVGFREFVELPLMRDLVSAHFLRGMCLQDFTFVGIQEHYAEDLAYLGRLLGWPASALGNRTENSNPHPDYAAVARSVWRDKALLQRIHELHAGDMELYRQACALRRRTRAVSFWRKLLPIGR